MLSVKFPFTGDADEPSIQHRQLVCQVVIVLTFITQQNPQALILISAKSILSVLLR